MSRPTLRFLNRAHACSYCQKVHGVTFDAPPKVRPRLLWVRCRCGKSHYICRLCARLVGSTRDSGKTFVGMCAKGYCRRMIRADKALKGER